MSIFAPGRFLDAADGLAAGADQQADLLGVDLACGAAAGHTARSRPRPRNRREHRPQNLACGPRAAWSSVARMISSADAVDLQVELDAGDAVLRAGDLEVHVAVVVLVADDVGEQDPLVSPSFTRPIEMPATGLLIGTPASIRPSVAPQTEAIELEPFDSRMSEITRIVYGNSSGRAGPASTLRSASAPWPISRRPGPRIGRHFADRERREVVVEHELLASTRRSARRPAARRGRCRASTVTRACVSPRWNMAEPCARGSTSTSQSIAAALRSRGRRAACRSRIRSRTTRSSRSCQAA